MPAFDKALKEIVKTVSDHPNELEEVPFYVGLRGSFGDHQVNPRTLRSMFLGKLVCIEGIVTRCKLQPVRNQKCSTNEINRLPCATKGGSICPLRGKI